MALTAPGCPVTDTRRGRTEAASLDHDRAGGAARRAESRVPAFLRDLGAKPGSARVLFVAVVSVAAGGLNPPVTWPGLPGVQSMIRAQPEVNLLVLGVTLIAATLLFIGGILIDTDGRRRILIAALGVLMAASVFGLFVSAGPAFIASRLAGAAAAFTILPFGLALVATTYEGVVRATAIGIVYVAWGGTGALAPVLLTLLGPTGPTWPAFVVAALASGAALLFVRPRAPDLPAVARTQRSYVVATAAWALGIVVISAGAIDFGGRTADAIRLSLLAIGAGMLAGYAIWSRRARLRPGVGLLHVERRPLTVAVAVGVIIGFAQAAPMFQLPLFFNLVLGYGPFLGVVATAPFVAALVIAGPVAGVLLTRFGPRTLVAGGLAAIGLGNLAVAAVLGLDSAYAFFIVPMLLIGAGFVIGTTVRSAIIFASVPSGLPGTAAALNEASLLVGSRIGLAVLTAIITERALAIYAGSLGSIDPGARDAAVAAFRNVLVAIGTPSISQVAASVTAADVAAFASAFVSAFRESLAGTGVLALVSAPLAWIALGARDPLTTQWEHLDERAEAATATTA